MLALDDGELTQEIVKQKEYAANERVPRAWRKQEKKKPK